MYETSKWYVYLQDLLLLSQKGGGNVSAELMEVQRKAKANGVVSHYKVLGLQQTALPAEVKASYRYEPRESKDILLLNASVQGGYCMQAALC